jgi:hypothetical protein
MKCYSTCYKSPVLVLRQQFHSSLLLGINSVSSLAQPYSLPLMYPDNEQPLLVALYKPNATLSHALPHKVHINVSVFVTDCNHL